MKFLKEEHALNQLQFCLSVGKYNIEITVQSQKKIFDNLRGKLKIRFQYVNNYFRRFQQTHHDAWIDLRWTKNTT